ncbi:MAG: phosphohydrolase [Candidatus Omnitrophota bacterium]|nr:MAG: phosphohydrolase [Candidatus Omnitrophota bacterium]RKY42638.1 MAG: phosphohydrolase [Candidatus Omnitrophota bacterium]
MFRKEALKLLEERLKSKNLVKHSLAVEACMRRLAKEFGEDPDLWGLAGLLHDLDYEDTKDDFCRHGFVTAEFLKEKGIDRQIIEAIEAHPGHIERKTKMAKALYAVDPLTGLIIASCLMHPEKKLKALDTQFVINRFREKSFARGANREQIRSCQELGIALSEFISICLEAMKGISKELGL